MKNLFLCFFIMAAGMVVNAQEKPEGLFINSKAADFQAVDQNGSPVVLKELRKKGPVVIMFYRGYWCPYCNKALKRMNDSLQLIKDKGATLIAITPEGKQGIDSTVAKTGAAFSIIRVPEHPSSVSSGWEAKASRSSFILFILLLSAFRREWWFWC